MPLVEIGGIFAGWTASFNYSAGSSSVADLVLASRRQTYTFTLATALPLDARLIKTDVNPPRLKHWDELSGDAVGLMQAFLAGLVDISIKVDSTFFGLSQIAGSQVIAIKTVLRIDELLRNQPLHNGAIEIVATAAFKFGASNNFAASARVRVTADVQELLLRVGDLPIALPKIDFPDLDLSRLAPTTSFQPPGLPAWLGRLNEQQVAVTATTPITFAVDPALNWSTSPLTTLNITFGSAGSPQIVIKAFAASGRGGEIRVQGTVATNPVTIDAGQFQYANLLLKWDPITIDQIAVALTADPRWSAGVTFPRVALQAVDDSGAVIAIAGAIDVKDGNPAFRNLRLVEPYPLFLVEQPTDGLAKAFADAWRFVVVASSTSTNAPDPGPLLDAMARLGAAAARDIGSAASAALAGIAKLAGAILRKLADALAALRASTPTAIPDVAIEVHVDPTTWQLRQIVLTPAGRIDGGDTNKLVKTIDALGLRAAINFGWRPAILFDFGNPGGVYLLAVPGQTANLQFATLSTDLWFARGDGVEAARTADPSDGGRPKDPLIGLDIALPSLQYGGIVLAGVSAGQGVFFHKVKGTPLVPITPPRGGATVQIGTFDKVQLAPVQSTDVALKVNINPSVLPFLSKGDSGEGTGSSDFLTALQDKIGQVVWIDKSQSFTPSIESDGTVKVPLVISLKAAGVRTDVKLDAIFDLKTLAMRIGDGDTLIIKAKDKNPIAQDALGLRWILTPAQDSLALLKLSFVDGDTRLALADGGAALEVDFPDISSDGRGLVFKAKSFAVSRSGLDLRATISPDPVVLNGVGTAFQFTDGELQIVGSRMVAARIAGSGRLPPELVGDAKANVVIAFQAARDGSVEIASAHAELDKSGDPIVCDGTRFHFTITKLGFSFVRDGGYHFYFLLTGSAEFRPNAGEHTDGLLQYLKTIRIDLDQAPLAGDLRVLMRHISIQVPISPRKKFPLFNLFEFELRGIGFYPASDQFDGDPALSLSGQILFAFGDIAQTSFDFHAVYISRPAAGQIMPRVRAEGLIVDIRLSGAGRLSGGVSAVDGKMPELIVKSPLPDSIKAYGFLGQGRLAIDGFADMAAAMGFLEVEVGPGDRRKAFFIYLQANKLSYPIETPIGALYIREVGFGFGYRYTLASIKAIDTIDSIAQLIKVLDDASKRQGELSSYAAWAPDAESDPARLTLALRAMISLESASEMEDYNDKEEKELPNPLLFDIVAALRSDFTFMMTIRAWLSVNYDEYQSSAPNSEVRENPLLRGYMFLSAPRSEFLARFLSDPNGYIGKHPALPGPAKDAFKNVQFSSTLFIKPGLFHFELGWPDQLRWHMEQGSLKAVCSGGAVFRVTDEEVLQGFNVAADVSMSISGQVGGDSFGAAASADLQAHVAAKLIAVLGIRDFSDTMFYGYISIDIGIGFRVEAWLRFKAFGHTISLSVGFSFSLQISVAAELVIDTRGVGAQVTCYVSIQAFGRGLSVRVGLTVNNSQLEWARRRVQRYMALGLTADTPDPSRMLSTQAGDQATEDEARRADAKGGAARRRRGLSRMDLLRAALASGNPVNSCKSSKFNVLLRRASKLPVVISRAKAPGDWYFAWLVPEEPNQPKSSVMVDKNFCMFYAAPLTSGETGRAFDHEIKFTKAPGNQTLWWFDPNKDPNNRWTAVAAATVDSKVRYDAADHFSFDNPDKGGSPKPRDVKLDEYFRRCFLFPDDKPQILLGDANGNPVNIDSAADIGEPLAKTYQPLDLRQFSGDDLTANLRNRQQDREALAVPADDLAHEARSYLLVRFFDDFCKFAADPTPPQGRIHVTDLGLVFLIHKSEFDSGGVLADDQIDKQKVTVVKRMAGADLKQEESPLAVFNRPSKQFENQSRRVAITPPRTEVLPDAIKMDWDLVSADGQNDDLDGNLQYYRVERTIRGHEETPAIFTSRHCDTLGRDLEKDTTTHVLMRGPWRFSDDLRDLDASWRRALLPAASPDDAQQALEAWETRVESATDVAVEYTVTPVDLAGTEGEARSFAVTIPRPSAPIRPANAHLVFEFDHASIASRQSLLAFINIDDRHWTPAGKDGWTRCYQLVVQWEEALPVGSYGGDELTHRPAAPGAAGQDSAAAKTAQEVSLEFDYRPDFHRDDVDHWQQQADQDQPRAAHKYLILAVGDPVEDTPLLRLASTSDEEDNTWDWGADYRPIFKFADGQAKILFDTLRGVPGSPRSCRFFLETLVVNKKSKAQPVPARVPVDFELRLLKWQPKQLPTQVGTTVKNPVPEYYVTRPQRFEWPLLKDLPAAVRDDIRAVGGFVHWLMPRPDALLATFLGKKPATALYSIRDPDRQVATHVRWNVMPSAPAKPDDPPPPTAGYDIFAVDLAEVPADESWTALSTWQKRARQTGRVQLIPADVAALTPANTRDLKKWRAFYPSESWRTFRGYDAPSTGKDQFAGDAPVQRPWYSAAESYVAWPLWTIRRCLVPSPDEQAITQVFAGGLPVAIRALVQRRAQADKPADPLPDNLLSLGGVSSDERTWLGENLNIEVPQQGAALYTSLADSQKFTVGQVRGLLRTLKSDVSATIKGQPAREWFHDATPVQKDAFLAELSNYDLVIDALDGSSKSASRLSQAQIRLNFDRRLHPVLEELVADLSYVVAAPAVGALAVGAAPLVYRRYTVQVGPEPPIPSKDVDGYLSDSSESNDPYGWGVLQKLGLAVPLRLYDNDKLIFLDPALLARNVETALRAIKARYQAPYPEWGNFGLPIVDVMLKPYGATVLAPPDQPNNPNNPLDVNFTAVGLSLLQVELRPGIKPGWTYGTYQTIPSDWAATGPILVTFQLLDTMSAVTIADAAFGAELELSGDQATGSFTLDRLPKKDETAFVIRYPKEFDPANETKGVKVTVTGAEFRFVANSKPPGGAPDAGGLYQRFHALNVDNWIALLASSTPTGHDFQRRWKMFAWSMSGRLAKADVPLASSDETTKQRLQSLLAAYLPWTDRFIERAAIPPADPGPLGQGVSVGVPFAIAEFAPANPVRLAAGTDGRVDTILLHQDRWAQSHAFAVRPFGRYAQLIEATGWMMPRQDGDVARCAVRQESKALPGAGSADDVFANFDVAVTSRTERLAAPVIIGTTRLDLEGSEKIPRRPGKIWELVLARHGEQAITVSNRNVLAKLDFLGLRLGFLRQYVHDDWPDRLNVNDPSLFPQRAGATLPQVSDAPVIENKTLRELVARYPTLWRGARVLHMDALPHFYRVYALAHAASGDVVSSVSAVVQQDFYYELSRVALDAFSWQVVPVNGGKRVRFNVPLARYRDVADQDAVATWFPQGGTVADLPDPEVAYQISLVQQADRQRGITTSTAELEIEITALHGIGDMQSKAPFAGRARGTRFKVPEGKALADLGPAHAGNPATWSLPQADFERYWADSVAPTRKITKDNFPDDQWKVIDKAMVGQTVTPDKFEAWSTVAPRGQLSVWIIGKSGTKIDLPNFKARANNLFGQVDPYVNAIAAVGPHDPWQSLRELRDRLDYLRGLTTEQQLADLLGGRDRYAQTFSDWICGVRIRPPTGSGADMIETVTQWFDPDLSPRSAYVLFTQLENSSARASLLRGFSAFHAARARADFDGAPSSSIPVSSEFGQHDIAIVASWQQRPAWLGFDRTRQLTIQKPANAHELEKLKSAMDDFMAELHQDATRPHAQRVLAFVFDLSAKIAAASGNIDAIFPTGKEITWMGPFDLALDPVTVEAPLLIKTDPAASMQLTFRAMPLSTELADARAWIAAHLSLGGADVVTKALNTLASQQLFDGYALVRLTAFRGIAAPQQVQMLAVA
jgi:hypothetical protein